MATSQHLTAKGHTWTCYKEKELLLRRFTVIAVWKTTSAFIHGDGNRLGPSMSGGVAVSTATEKTNTYEKHPNMQKCRGHLTCTIVQRHAHTHADEKKFTKACDQEECTTETCKQETSAHSITVSRKTPAELKCR